MDNVNRNILVIDDNLTVCLMLKSWLVKKGFSVETAINVLEAKQKVKEQPFDLILSDIRMPDADGFSFLAWVKKYDSDILVIMMTGYADIESAVESMKSGAVDYISKPIEPEQLFKKIDEAILRQERMLKQKGFSDDFIKFPGAEYKQLYKQLDHIIENDQHRLILGDRGTGKLSAVKYIYEKGTHLPKPLVILDNDKSADVVNSYRKLSDRSDHKSPLMRKFLEAKGGLLYIRQIAYLDINQQDELLNILTRQKKDDDFTQVIMSSEMRKEELQKRLIPKLYNLVIQDCIVLPTLKDKKEVIIFLANHFLRFANATLDKQIDTIDPAVLDRLAGYAWPENIQELKNCIIKAALLTDETTIPPSIIPELFGKGAKNNNRSQLLNPIQGLRKEYYEKEKIMEALELAKGNKTMAASILNIDRKTLYNKMKLYNVIINN
ncbi:sigma-54 dependent transcriptional regulator [Proteiniphilum sp. X52]|uniref:sigma-54-dependent transcriptional regulator n=1 Tax=Proteiniphilum sp. X52 TaxID=2382159 RepID=UPI000F0A3D75|nr:response regulator [Proteiniphilum sp. X52]RNC64686.1 sigma-54-dependent Fis family transcriptional regulator [Proteiniphilum sp. X52]